MVQGQASNRRKGFFGTAYSRAAVILPLSDHLYFFWHFRQKKAQWTRQGPRHWFEHPGQEGWHPKHSKMCWAVSAVDVGAVVALRVE